MDYISLRLEGDVPGWRTMATGLKWLKSFARGLCSPVTLSRSPMKSGGSSSSKTT
jgi:hypothetical protein